MVKENDLYNGGVVATRDALQTGPAGKQVFVTAVSEGFYLKTRKRGETFGFPAERLFENDGTPKAKTPTWFVPASEGDVQRTNDAVEGDAARVFASQRYEQPNNAAQVRAANAAHADAVKAAEPKVEHDETPEEKASRLQAEARADVEQAQRQQLAGEERANRNREASKANAAVGAPAGRQSPEQADAQAQATVEGARLRDEANKLDASGGKENKAKAKELRDQADKLQVSGLDLA